MLGDRVIKEVAKGKSDGWAQIPADRWCPYKKRVGTRAHTRGQTLEDTGRSCSSSCQAEGPQKRPTPLTS